ncbi:VCBS domain-containing protein [uncultured Gilvimarinus sp.]|uniref:VCBS domain-containing protein n=1 Tax=uncultured Gilvimarinus sp. TaxID=1689143 RepID=UPI0030EF2723
MLSVNSGDVIVSGATGGVINWVFSSGSEVFDYLEQDDQLTLEYTVVVTDSQGATAEHIVTIVITGTNDTAVREDTTLTANGSLSVFDIDNPDMAFIADTYADDYGTLTVSADGSWSYQLNQNETVDALSIGETRDQVYTIALTDGGDTATTNDDDVETTVTIHIQGVNDRPTVEDLTFSVNENQNLELRQLSGADVDGEIYGYGLISDVSEGGLSLQPNGTFRFLTRGEFDDLAAGETREVTFEYAAADNNGAVSAPGTVTITVVGIDNAPEIGSSSGNVVENISPTASGIISASDVDNPALAFIADAYSGVWGDLTINVDGGWSYTLRAADADPLDQGDEVTDNFVVNLNDDISTANIIINVTGTNDAPTLDDPLITVNSNEDSIYQGALSIVSDVDQDDGYIDDDGNGITKGFFYGLVEADDFAPGSLIFNTDGTYTFDPRFAYSDLDDGDVEVLSFTYRAFDEQGARSDIGTITFTLSGSTDDEPADPNFGIIIEDATDSVSGGPLDSYTPGSYDDDYGTLVVDGDGNWTYTLDPDRANGSEAPSIPALGPGDDITVVIPAGAGNDEVTIEIIGTNDAPVVEDLPCNIVVTGENSLISGQLNGTDVDGTIVTYEVLNSDELGDATLVINADGSFTFDPGTEFDHLPDGVTTSLSFTFQAIDNNGAVSNIGTGCITVEGEDDLPALSNDSGRVIEDDAANNVAAGVIVFTDVDDGESADGAVNFVEQNIEGVYGHFTLDNGGNWTYILDNIDPDTDALNAGQEVTDEFTVAATNGATSTVIVTVTGSNDVPVIDGSDNNVSASIDEDTALANVLPLATDVDSLGRIVGYVQRGDLIYVSDDSTAPGELIFYSDGTYLFDPRGSYDYLAEGETTQVEFNFAAVDNESGVSNEQTVTITIVGVDDLPVISADTVNITEDDTNPAATGQLTAADPDDDGADLSFIPVTLDGDYGTLTLDANGNWEYNLGPNAQALNNGDDEADVFTINLSDGSTTTVTVNVEGINDVPVSDDIVVTVDEDSVLNASVPAATDVDGTVIAYRLVDGSFAGPGSLSFSTDGSYSYDPGDNFQELDAGDTGQVTFQYIVQDNSDGISDPITVTINVTGVNDAPTSSAIANQSSDESEAVSVDVSGSFADIDADNVFTYSASGLPPSLTIDPVSGVISGTLDADAAAGSVYNVTVTATDSGGEATSQSFSWIIANPTPDFVGETSGNDDDTYAFSLNEGTPSGTEVGAVSAIDPDGDTLTYSITAGNSAGWFAIDSSSGAISLTADVDDAQVGSYSLSVDADDGQGGTDTATVNIDLLNVNDPPVVTGSAIAVAEECVNTPLGIAAPTDADGDALTVTVTGLPDVGEVTLANGTVLALNDTFSAVELTGLLYSAPQELAADYMGSFDFSVDDGQGAANSVQSASVDISVSAVNDAPVAVDDVVDSVPNNSTGIVIDVLANDTDAENDDLTVFSATAETGTVTINADGTLNYVPASGFIGTDNIVYQVNDTSGASDLGNVTVSVFSGIETFAASAQSQPNTATAFAAGAFAAGAFAMDAVAIDAAAIESADQPEADVLDWHLAEPSANDQPAAGEFNSSGQALGFGDLLEDDDEDLSQWLPGAEEPAAGSTSPVLLDASAPIANADAPYLPSGDSAAYSSDNSDASEFLLNHAQANVDL